MDEFRDEALIVRFGIMALRDVKRSLEDAMDDPEVECYELSFFGGNDMTEEEIARIAERPNPRMRVSSFGRLRSQGFEPYRDEPPEAHLGLNFDEWPSDEELNKLIDLFDEPIENPHPL